MDSQILQYFPTWSLCLCVCARMRARACMRVRTSFVIIYAKLCSTDDFLGEKQKQTMES